MDKISNKEFALLNHCIYERDGELWVKHDNGVKFTCSPLFSVSESIENDDGINVCQSDYVDREFYYILDNDEKRELIKTLSK